MAKGTNQANKSENPPASPAVDKKNDGKYSLHINIGWTFSNDQKNLPKGQYTLRVAGQTVHDGNGNKFSNGKIIIDKALNNLTGSGELIIKLTDGSTYRAKVKLGKIKPIQTPEGLAYRLTNLGFYAGDGKANNRLYWAIRAFKRVKMNDFTHNKVEMENNCATKAFLGAVQKAYGVHPDDKFTGELKLQKDTASVPYCGMFGTRVYHQGENDNSKDNKHKSNNRAEPIAGDFPLYLRAFDPEDNDFKCRGPFSNRINLPQPIHMAQFVLFELGYWLVADEAKYPSEWEKIEDTWTRNQYQPNGEYGTYTQWAVQGFQRYAKMGLASKENITSKEERYLSRLELSKLPEVTGEARYPVTEEIDGVLNQATKKALQAWTDGVLRCPMVIFPSTDNKTGSFYSDYKSKEREYNQEQFDKYCYGYVTPDSNIWKDIWHGAYAVGEIISGGFGIAGGIAVAGIGSETGAAIPLGILIAMHGSNTFISGCNDLAGVFSENRIGYGYGNLNLLYEDYQLIFGKTLGSVMYTGIDIATGLGGFKATLKAVWSGVKITEKSGYIIMSVLPKINNLVKESYKTAIVMGIGQRTVEGYIVIRDGAIYIMDSKQTCTDITTWIKEINKKYNFYR